MPLVDGVKMACAACIRGHRSTSCQHADRPLLEVRKKGRPMSQCDHCRDLRKVKQVHVRCNCKPDESEAPKRKGKGKQAEAEHSGAPCNCDETGTCTCATPRATKTRGDRRLSAPPIPLSVSPTTPIQTESSPSGPSESSETSWPSCCLTTDPSTGTPGLKYGAASESSEASWPSCCLTTDTSTGNPGLKYGASKASTSGSESRRTGPSTPPDGTKSCPVNDAPAELPHFNPEPPQITIPPLFPMLNYPPADDPLQFQTQARSHRYTPYPTAVQPSSASYAGPSRNFRSSNTQSMDPAPAFDNETLALWDQFLREDVADAPERANLNMPYPIADVLALSESYLTADVSPPSSCACSPGSSCASCLPSEPGHMPSTSITNLIPSNCTTPCTEFDCSALAAAMALIDEDFPAVGDSLPTQPTRPALSDQTFNHPLDANYLHNLSVPDNLHVGGLGAMNNPVSQLQPRLKANLEQLGLHSALNVGCTCGSKCACFLCPAEPSTTSVSTEAAESCAFCSNCRAIDQTLAEMQRTSAPAIF